MSDILPTPSPSPKPTKVLLIDDNQLSRDVLRTILRDAGYVHIREASAADAGLKMATYFLPDLICLDVHMPGKSGVALLGELKVLLPQAVVVMVSASNDRSTVEASMKDRADGYVIKPFNAATLLKVLNTCLARGKTSSVESPTELPSGSEA